MFDSLLLRILCVLLSLFPPPPSHSLSSPPPPSALSFLPSIMSRVSLLLLVCFVLVVLSGWSSVSVSAAPPSLLLSNGSRVMSPYQVAAPAADGSSGTEPVQTQCECVKGCTGKYKQGQTFFTLCSSGAEGCSSTGGPTCVAACAAICKVNGGTTSTCNQFKSPQCICHNPQTTCEKGVSGGNGDNTPSDGTVITLIGQPSDN